MDFRQRAGLGLIGVALAACGGGSTVTAHRTTSPSPVQTSPVRTQASEPLPSPAPAPHVPVQKLHVPGGQALPTGTVMIRLHGVQGFEPGATELAAGLGAVWAPDGLFRIDPASNTSSKPLAPSSAETDSIAVGDGSVWVVDDFHGNLLRFDRVGKPRGEFSLPDGLPEELVATGGSVWVTLHHGGGVAQIDAASGNVVRTVALTPQGPDGVQGITAGAGDLWTGALNSNAIFGIDIKSRKTTSVSVGTNGDPCGGLAVTTKDVWATQCADGDQIYRVARTSGKLAGVYDAGGKSLSLAADGDTVWFVAGGDPDNSPNRPSHLIELDAHGQVLQDYQLPRGFTSGGIVTAFGSLWLSSVHVPTVIRVPLSTARGSAG